MGQFYFGVLGRRWVKIQSALTSGMNEEWLRWFPSNPPARQGAKLPVRIPGLKVSIAAVAEA